MMKIRSIFSSPIPRMPRIRSFRREGPGDLYVNGRVDDDICRAYSTNAITLDALLDHLEVKVGHTKEIGRQVGDYRVCEDGQRIVWSAVYRVQRRKLAASGASSATHTGGVSGHLTVFGKEMSQTAQGILLLPKDWVVRDARQDYPGGVEGHGGRRGGTILSAAFQMTGIRFKAVAKSTPRYSECSNPSRLRSNVGRVKPPQRWCRTNAGIPGLLGPIFVVIRMSTVSARAMRDSSTWCNITIWGLASFISAPPNAHASGSTHSL
ncbi:hypothetical protein B0H10DRAFT_1938753 [Mycena sp. CBHHK59/15]|nr:hypothetical protein B0H10DRAFT_1938753 [Mycena sp. CBHHK59/15]